MVNSLYYGGVLLLLCVLTLSLFYGIQKGVKHQRLYYFMDCPSKLPDYVIITSTYYWLTSFYLGQGVQFISVHPFVSRFSRPFLRIPCPDKKKGELYTYLLHGPSLFVNVRQHIRSTMPKQDDHGCHNNFDFSNSLCSICAWPEEPRNEIWNEGDNFCFLGGSEIAVTPK